MPCLVITAHITLYAELCDPDETPLHPKEKKAELVFPPRRFSEHYFNHTTCVTMQKRPLLLFLVNKKKMYPFTLGLLIYESAYPVFCMMTQACSAHNDK